MLIDEINKGPADSVVGVDAVDGCTLLLPWRLHLQASHIGSTGAAERHLGADAELVEVPPGL